MTSTECILAGDFLLTMDGQNRVIPNGAVHIADGRILAVDRLHALAAASPSTPVKRVRNSVLMPGLINAHAHSGFLRGTAEHLPVWDWLTSERKVKEAHIRANAAKVALTAAQRRLLADLSEFYNEADIARQQLASLDASVLTARESLRLTNLRYVDGEGTVLDVVDAENTLISSENARVDAMVRYQQALAQLETLTGRI